MLAFDNILAKINDLFVFADLKEKPLSILVNILVYWRVIALVYTRHLLLVTALTRSTINMPKFYSPLPCPAAAFCGVQTSLEEDSRTEDAAVTLEDPNSLNNCSEQVFLLMLSSSKFSEEKLTQSILGFFFFNNEMITWRHWALHL